MLGARGKLCTKAFGVADRDGNGSGCSFRGVITITMPWIDDRNGSGAMGGAVAVVRESLWDRFERLLFFERWTFSGRWGDGWSWYAG